MWFKKLIGLWTRGTYDIHTLASHVFLSSLGENKYPKIILEKKTTKNTCKNVGKQEKFTLWSRNYKEPWKTEIRWDQIRGRNQTKLSQEQLLKRVGVTSGYSKFRYWILKNMALGGNCDTHSLGCCDDLRRWFNPCNIIPLHWITASRGVCPRETVIRNNGSKEAKQSTILLESRRKFLPVPRKLHLPAWNNHCNRWDEHNIWRQMNTLQK